MGAADVATVLFTQFLKFDAADPNWPDRDRFVLSAGHGSMLLYALLYLTGNTEMTLDQLKHFRQLGSLTPGHPENFHTKGIETTTGPLGQGIATSVGMALAERMLAAEFGKKIVDHHTYVLASDGDLMEGVSQEAIALAGHWKLNKLIVLYDDNGISIDGPTSLSDSVDQVKRFKSAGWQAELIDGQDQKAIAAAITRAQEIQQAVADRLQDHDRLRRADQGRHQQGPWRGARRRRTQGRQGKPRHLAGAVLGARRRAEEPGARPAAAAPRARKEWEARLATLSNRKRAEFDRRLRHERPAGAGESAQGAQEVAAGDAAEYRHPQIIGVGDRRDRRRDADGIPVAARPTSPAPTTTRRNPPSNFSAKTPKGRFIHYGIREHGMAAAMNGIFLHGGFAPNGATFLVFTDYAARRCGWRR